MVECTNQQLGGGAGAEALNMGALGIWLVFEARGLERASGERVWRETGAKGPQLQDLCPHHPQVRS